MSTPSPNLVLVGFMGTGKTTVGKILARRLQRPFVDLDHVIEAQAGMSIAQYFEQHGEPAFRALESEVVQQVSSEPGQVIACGGGAILNPDNKLALEASGTIICLQASPAKILERIAHHSHRPLLEGEDRAERLQAIYDERKPLYDQLALQINTDGLSLEEVAEAVLKMISPSAGGSTSSLT